MLLFRLQRENYHLRFIPKRQWGYPDENFPAATGWPRTKNQLKTFVYNIAGSNSNCRQTIHPATKSKLVANVDAAITNPQLCWNCRKIPRRTVMRKLMRRP